MNNLVILQKPAHLRHRTASLVLCIVIINCMLSALTGCNSKKLALSSPISVTDYKLNTYVQIDSYTNVNKNVLSDALGLCDYYEHIFSRTLETSELYKVNTQQTTAISDELYELIELGLYYSQLSYGAFDITIGSVSRLWDFNTDTPDVPDSSAIADALAYVDYTKVSLSTDNDGTHHISIPDGYCLDLGAIAKGYIADKIKAYLIDNGVERAIINLGGNVLCIGQKRNGSDFNIAAGSFVAFIIALLGGNVVVQGIAFILVSVVLLALTKPWAGKYINSRTVKTNVDSLVGERAVLTEDADSMKQTGKAVVNGQEWTVRPQDETQVIRKGELIEVVKISGVKLIVKRVKEA